MFSVTKKAIGFMEQQVQAKQPFYLQISHYAMHEGRECLPATREKYVNHPAVQAYYKKLGTTAENGEAQGRSCDLARHGRGPGRTDRRGA